MVRIHACHAWGRGFEPRRSRQLQKELLYAAFFVTAWKSRLNPQSRGLEDKNSRFIVKVGGGVKKLGSSSKLGAE